jgi:metallo-beta-lactamase family protein
MQISSYGAAGRVTGSKHLITTASGRRILLDCGLIQGEGKEGAELNRHFGFDPSALHDVIISHAHIDHSGLLPSLVRQGYKGPVWCNAPTRDLLEIMLMDSAKIQESDLNHVNKRRAAQGLEPLKPIYDEEDVRQVLRQIQLMPEHKDYWELSSDVAVRTTDNAHILGSVAITLAIKENGKETKITFTGDIGRPGDHILRGPDPFPQSDVIICESTYGDRLHEPSVDSEDHLLRIVRETCVERSGKLIIPAFSVDRTQEIIYLLDRLSHDGRLPRIPVYVDSPLSVNATRIMAMHRQCFNQEILEYITRDGDPFAFPNLRYISKVEESKALNDDQQPAIIISASGMAEAGRVKHHILNHVEDPDSTILIVGYATPASLAGQLRARNERVKIFGDWYQVNCHIEVMDSFSAHADYREMLEYLGSQNPAQVKQMFLVHGNERALQAWKSRLLDKGFTNVTIVEHGEVYDC